MKTLFIVLGVILLAFVLFQLYLKNEQKDIETYSYVVDQKYEAFEIRSYEASLFSSVRISGDTYSDVSGRGFSILANYIFGGNEKNEKIAMTSPVAMSLEDSITMMFMVPKKYKKETLPRPDQSQIRFREEPAKTVAAISFGGWANDQKIEKYKQKLVAALDKNGIAHTEQFYFFGYNPPFELFNRRNELIVELEAQPHKP